MTLADCFIASFLLHLGAFEVLRGDVGEGLLDLALVVLFLLHCYVIEVWRQRRAYTGTMGSRPNASNNSL